MVESRRVQQAIEGQLTDSGSRLTITRWSRIRGPKVPVLHGSRICHVRAQLQRDLITTTVWWTEAGAAGINERLIFTIRPVLLNDTFDPLAAPHFDLFSGFCWRLTCF